MSAIVVLMTAASLDEARSIAAALVAERLAACCSIVKDVESVYRWQDAVEQSAEALVIIKTERRMFPALSARVAEPHSYDVPELIALPVTHGLPAYLSWLGESLSA